MTTAVYIGPSVSIEDARRILPDALFRPPAAQGDLLTAVESYGATTLVLIDGTFRQSLSVWHSEICYALSRGITVFGASSMGALRGAETAPLGAIGIGTVFEWYRDGFVTGDDEVALAHGEADQSFCKLSEPLVNIRATFRQAVANGRIHQADADQIIRVMKARYFPDRSIPALAEDLAAAGWDPVNIEQARRILRDHYVDIKRDDAIACLEAVKRHLASPPTPAEPLKFTRSYVFETLYNLDRRVLHDGVEVPLQHIAEHFTVHCPEAEDAWDAALDRGLLVFLANMVGFVLSDADIVDEAQRFFDARGLHTPRAIEAWRRRNDLNADELDQLIRNSAAIRSLRRWLLANRGLDRGVKHVLDELRLCGTYPAWAGAAAQESAAWMAYADSDYPATLQDVAYLEADHLAATGREVRCSPEWAFDAGFEDPQGVREALRRAAVSRDVRRRITAALERLPPDLSTEDAQDLARQVTAGAKGPL